MEKLIDYKQNKNQKTQSEWRKIIEDADKLARQISEYQFERYYQYHGGKEIWDRAIPAVEELRSEIEVHPNLEEEEIKVFDSKSLII